MQWLELIFFVLICIAGGFELFKTEKLYNWWKKHPKWWTKSKWMLDLPKSQAITIMRLVGIIALLIGFYAIYYLIFVGTF